jgi:hypothetical protein
MCQAYDGERRAYLREEQRAAKAGEYCHWCGDLAPYAPPFKPTRCNKCHWELCRKDHPWKFGKPAGETEHGQ